MNLFHRSVLHPAPGHALPTLLSISFTMNVSNASDFGGLFSEAANGDANDSSKRAGGALSEERRTKLRRYDHVASQAINPYGVSTIRAASTKDLWRTVSNGGRTAMHHGNMAATGASGGDYRCGVGLSQFAQAILAATTEMGSATCGKLLNKQARDAASTEAADLEPHLSILDAGKGSESSDKGGGKGFGSLRAAGGDERDRPAADKITLATQEVHAWLSNNGSPLQAMIHLLSGGGAFFAASCAEKTARACIEHKPATRNDFERWMVARWSPVVGPSA